MLTRSFTAAFALAGASLAMTPAASAAEDGARTVGVAYDDLDLTTAEGKEELDRRIDRAAKDACGFGESQVGTRIRTGEQRDCYRQAKRQLDRHLARIVEDAQRGG